jgi:hypothetical protein
VQDAGNFQTFPEKRLAMQQLLRSIADERASQGAYRNPWAGLSDDQLDTYTSQVIDRLQKIRTQDLQAAYAIYLESEAGNKPPQHRLGDLEAALQAAQARGDELQGSAKASNRTYQEQLKRDIEIQRRLFENRADLRGDRNVGESNISTLLHENREKPGYVRVYMTVFAPSTDDTHKDLLKHGPSRIVGRSHQVWLNFGSPARALSYVNAYRLQTGPGAMPVIRSMLVPMSFLEAHFPKAITESEKSAIEGWSRTSSTRQVNRRQEKLKVVQEQPFMNTDTKYANQMGLAAMTDQLIYSRPGEAHRSDRSSEATQDVPWAERELTPTDLQAMAKASKRPTGKNIGRDFKIVTSTVNPIYQALLDAADPDSFTTYADPEAFDARHDPSVDGRMGDYRSLASSIGLASTGEPFTVHLLRGGEHPATMFSLYEDGKWASPSNYELGALIDETNVLFDQLDRLPDDGALGQADSDEIGQDLRAPLGDLLEANRLAPRDLSLSGEVGQRRDVYGNTAAKVAFEKTFADEYMNSYIWRANMSKWSRSLATFIQQEVNANALYGNPYVQHDMKALGREAQGAQAGTPIEELEKMSEQTSSPVQVDLFFHLLRGLASAKPDLKKDKLGRKLFTVNNRTVGTPFDVINPRPGERDTRSDASVNRFKPNRSLKETTLMRDLDAPFLGGVSGTTRDYNNMLSAVFGALSAEEFWHFQLLNAAFMVKHGYHSMFEALYPATFYERSRGDTMQQEYDMLRRQPGAIDDIDFYRPALTAALGADGEALWDRVRRRV